MLPPNPLANIVASGLTSAHPSDEQTLTGLDPSALPAEDIVDREAPDPVEARAALVTQMSERVCEARSYWKKLAFDQMRLDQRFVSGKQWPQAKQTDLGIVDEIKDRYVANITLRHVNQRTAEIYGKNPKIVARKKQRLNTVMWDGSMQALQMAMQNSGRPALGVDPMTGAPVPDPAAVEAQQIVMEAVKVITEEKQLTKLGKTLELLFEHQVEEQTIPFKVQLKTTVRRALTTGVGWVKLGYQRVMDKSPELERQINDMSQKLATIERLSADLEDGVLDPNAAEAEQLRLTIQDLSTQQDVIVREGLTFSYPDSTAIIPDKNCRQLRGFVGCEFVAEEFILSKERIQEIWGVDVGTGGAKTYVERGDGTRDYQQEEAMWAAQKALRYCVWEVYNKEDGLVYFLCDGYADFLAEPAAPDVWLERFWPWFPLVFNEVYDDENVFPPSDVFLMRDQQHEINRSRQSLREHRRASRPAIITAAATLSDPDKNKLANHEAHALIELQGLQPGEDIKTKLQAWSGATLDPALYDPTFAYEDLLRVTGSQEANLGGTSGATATESSIAQGSRSNASSSTVDDLDEFLTEIARSGGQLLLKECAVDTVKEIVGPGAVWPEFSKDQIAKEIFLEVEAASTGRPNKAQEVQTAQAIMPFIMQIPGISPEWLAREMLRRMDDRMDLTDAFASGLPSIQSMNRPAPSAAGPGKPGAPGAGGEGKGSEKDPSAQGPAGGNNAPSTEPKQVNAAPRDPGQLPGAAGMM